MPRDLNYYYRLVAGANNYQDVMALLKALSDQIADIRFELQVPGSPMSYSDSESVRKKMVWYLQNVIDTIRRTRENNDRRLSEPVDDLDS